MPLSKPTQALRRELQGTASDLKWSAVELMRIAERLSLAGNETDAQAVLRICQVMQDVEGRLEAYADEVRDGHANQNQLYM
ncbi:hypothetical protein [Pseudomonas typographi]|uniref:Prophage PssSM-02 n=1 Tax=Pseudomonas typographi TaxID=2715964 RepID=A0ABR7ZA94_9PSED|nr:hypothetical protein [Pseudomonas typographi]MBD1602384.1 hypothetical protein [Pseudomonas typographi]